VNVALGVLELAEPTHRKVRNEWGTASCDLYLGLDFRGGFGVPMLSFGDRGVLGEIPGIQALASTVWHQRDNEAGLVWVHVRKTCVARRISFLCVTTPS